MRRRPPSDSKDPPRTRQGPLTLAAFRPWGGSWDGRRARGLPASLLADDVTADRPVDQPADQSTRRLLDVAALAQGRKCPTPGDPPRPGPGAKPSDTLHGGGFA